MKVEPGPLVSVVIPVKNGDAWLGDTLAAIFGQTLASKMEVIVIDSGSTDRTLSILSQFPVRLHSISPESFNHGTVRNLGASLASGTYVVMTVQDARPVDEKWLEHLLAGFEDEQVAGVCGLQVVPHEKDKNPVAWFRPQSAPGITRYSFSAADFDALSPDEKKKICSWDNVNAAYRRDTLLKFPFQAVTFAEDALWAKEVVRSGYSLVYNNAARVFHYHFETPDFTYRRKFTIFYHFYKIFGVKPGGYSSEIVHILRNIKILFPEKSLGWREKWGWIRYNHNYRKAVNRAVCQFNDALSSGEKALALKHEAICGKPPQALKPA